ncbi:uncharacterized protein [Diabrotica undecimpunctata]|uniref:uncharacterized protein n=1 Tax=Diabrotica undecimpunctata TaxID=50387 RepID=UPI003B6375EE
MTSFIQFNAGRGLEATDKLINKMTSEKIDIALIQEPGHNIWQNTDYNTVGLYKTSKAPILVNKKLTKQVTLITNRTDQNTTTIHLQSGNAIYTITNIYDAPGGDNNVTLDKHKTQLETDPNKTILAGDFNAKHTSWGGNTTDSRGQDIIDWTTLHHIYIHNKHNSPPTFLTLRGKSWIDLTLTKNTTVNDWMVVEEETLSDHQYITFNIHRRTQNNLNINKHKLNITHINKDKLNTLINTKDWDLSGTINLKAERLQQDIIQITKESSRKERKNRTPNQIWWSEELDKLKKATNKCRRKYQKETDPINKRRDELDYIASRRRYKDAIIQTKKTAIRQYLTNHDPDNPWNLGYKIIKKKEDSNSTLNTIRKPDGTYTTNRDDTIKYLHTKYFPPDSENDDNETHRALREKEYTHDTENDTKFTQQEIHNTIRDMKNKKATATDGLSKELIELIHNTKPELLTELYN